MGRKLNGNISRAAAAILYIGAFGASGQSFKHDEINRLTDVIYPDGRMRHFVYDASGNIVRIYGSMGGFGGGGGRLPHTGITQSQCYQAGSSILISCESAGALDLSGAERQDGMRTANNPMSYSNVGGFSRDECVRDNLTGLVWEGKTSSGLRSGLNLYSNWGDGRSGDASEYVRKVNGMSLCGFTNWRLPSVEELQSLVDYSKVGNSPAIAIDTTWFVNSVSGPYWSYQNFMNDPNRAWVVRFDWGILNSWVRDSARVRLVRGGV